MLVVCCAHQGSGEIRQHVGLPAGVGDGPGDALGVLVGSGPGEDAGHAGQATRSAGIGQAAAMGSANKLYHSTVIFAVPEPLSRRSRADTVQVWPGVTEICGIRTYCGLNPSTSPIWV